MPSDVSIVRSPRKELILYLVVLTFFFILLEISFFIQCNRAYLSDYQFMTEHLTLPWRMLPGILFFIFSQLLVHFGYTLLVWLLAVSLSSAIPLLTRYVISMGIALWLMGIVCALAVNQVYFPNSKFAELSGVMMSDWFAKLLAMTFASCFAGLFLLTSLLRYRLQAVMLTLTFISLSAYEAIHTPFALDAATLEKPNIILIGVDSLRPDYLSFFGSNRQTPFIDSFLEQSTVFSEALTPLARTFPSWVSILTGEHPRAMGVRTNLVEPERIQPATTLPYALRQNGYETLYATDETRFSNIDTYFGFDQVLTPPMGLNDFLLGSFNDFPLSNMLINTRIGQWLFPYSYANRPVHFAYDPDSFLARINPYLFKKRTKPLFFAVHFCLPHHPYLWADLSNHQYEPIERYAMSVLRVDRQLKDFFTQLKSARLLDHAIVVLLSDHGEALELPGDRVTEAALYVSQSSRKPPVFYPTPIDHMAINQTVGHGTDVLSVSQYHTVLAFRFYGLGAQYQGIVPGAMSLLAVKPALLGYIGNDRDRSTLLPIIQQRASPAIQSSHIFIESDFTPEAIRTVYPQTRDVILEGIELFQIDPVSTRLTVKKNMQEMIIHSKQYADIYGEWILALYPQSNGCRMPILVNLLTGEWSNDLRSPFAQHSPGNAMLAALKTFYGEEISNISDLPRQPPILFTKKT